MNDRTVAGNLPARLRCAESVLDLTAPQVMGVLNLTPDSIFDGGRCHLDGKLDLSLALRRAEAMVRAGATVMDVGGESTRPGARPVPTQEELDRVMPVVVAIARNLDVVISVDTSSPVVMREAIAAGAGMINDIRALQRPGSLETVAASRCAVCLMHMQGEPDHMQENPHYTDVVAEVRDYLHARSRRCLESGIGADRILLDPGFGFGKRLRHNVLLLQGLRRLRAGGFPLLVGLSRKSMIGALTGRWRIG